MNGLIGTIVSVLIATAISGGASAMSESEPWEAADAFLRDLAGGEQQTVMMYMDNRYVNVLENVTGTDEEMDRMEEALFRNFSYEMIDSAAKGSVAVVEVKVRNCDFSGIMDDYQKASYQYVTDNLYSEDVVNKEKLNKKCLDLYLDQIEKTASGEPTYENVVYLPMEEDGYGGWRMILNDEIMQSILGELEIPTDE